MEDYNQTFCNLKTLRQLAKIETLVSNAINVNEHQSIKQNEDILSPKKNSDEFDLNNSVTNQLNKLKLHLKEAEIVVLKERIHGENDIITKFNKTEPAEVDSLLSDIRSAITSAKEDISVNDSKKIIDGSATKNNEGVRSEFVLSSETKQFIELLLNQVVSQNLDKVIQDIIGHKIEKKNKVLDLSEVAVSPKNDT